MRVVQSIGVPHQPSIADVTLLCIALKSRTIPAADAVAQSLDACRWLRGQDARQIYFKVCSTFDSSPQGNIGPVIEALMDELHCDFSVATPAFPERWSHGLHGHLFVGHLLLSDTGIRNHPLTPMTDANLVHFLQIAARSASPCRKVGLIDLKVGRRFARRNPAPNRSTASQGISIAIADAISNNDLLRLGAALSDAPLVTAASGLALGLPASWGFAPSLQSSRLPPASGRKAIVAGSCSTATNEQVRHSSPPAEMPAR